MTSATNVCSYRNTPHKPPGVACSSASLDQSSKNSKSKPPHSLRITPLSPSSSFLPPSVPFPGISVVLHLYFSFLTSYSVPVLIGFYMPPYSNSVVGICSSLFLLKYMACISIISALHRTKKNHLSAFPRVYQISMRHTHHSPHSLITGTA